MAENFSNLSFPSEHQYVIVDSETDKVGTRKLAFLPMTFIINYNEANTENPPTLTLLINPRNMTTSTSKKVVASFTRQGNIVEEWGEMQDILQFSGTIGGYYIKKQAFGFSGLNRYERHKSVSFKNLYHLLLMYRNNGAIYEKTVKTTNTSQNKLIKNAGLIRVNRRVPKIIENTKNRITKVGDVFLSYDSVVYKGSFDDFSITESVEKPFSLDYDFVFTVQRKYENDFRSFNSYVQTSVVQDDISKNPGQVKRVIKSGLNTSTRAQKQETATLDGNSTFVDPKNLSTTDQFTISAAPAKTKRDYVRTLEAQGLNVSQEDQGNIQTNVEDIYSDVSGTNEKGSNDLYNTTKLVFIKNGKTDRKASQKATNLTSQAKTMVALDKKRAIS